MSTTRTATSLLAAGSLVYTAEALSTASFACAIHFEATIEAVLAEFHSSGTMQALASYLNEGKKEIFMLHWILILLLIAGVASLLGFRGVAGASAGIARILIFIVLIVFIIAIVGGFLVVA